MAMMASDGDVACFRLFRCVRVRPRASVCVPARRGRPVLLSLVSRNRAQWWQIAVSEGICGTLSWRCHFI